jgi:hypothetical protein
MLAIGPKVCGFKPGRCNGFLRAIKIRNTPFFGGEVKLGAPCRKIVWHVQNEISKCEKVASNAKFMFAKFPLICYKMNLLVAIPERDVVDE